MNSMNRQLGGRNVPAIAYYVDVSVGKHSFEALVDTGSSVTMISRDVYNAMEKYGKPIVPSNKNGGGATVQGIIEGQTMQIVGTVKVPLRMGNFSSEPHKLVVVEQASQKFILGLDFLDKYRITVDTSDRVLIIKAPRKIIRIPVRSVNMPGPEERNVVNCKTLVIPPRSGMDLDVKVKDMPHSLDGCIEQCGSVSSEIIIARSINTVIHGLTRVRVLNMNSYPVTIEKNQNLAKFVPVEETGVTRQASFHVSGVEDREDIFDLEHTDLSPQQKAKVVDLLGRFKNIMGKDEYDMGCTSTIKHGIDVQGSLPIKQTYRRFPQPLTREIGIEVEKLLDKGIIETSSSPWAAPLVPVRKKSGKLRLCIDYRALNSVTRKDSFPLPNLADAVGQFVDNKYFSSLDLLAGYHQIEMEEGSKELTAFSTGENLYQFKRMPFGVTNGPATFSRLVSVVLSGVPMNVAQAYLDDIIIAGKSFEDHLSNLECVFSRLSEHGLKLSVDKCAFFKTEVSYLGHMVGRDGIKPLESNVRAILEFPRPDTIKKLRTFNGMVNFYKKFIKGSEELMKPLYRATSAKILGWDDDCERSFEGAKQALTSSPILAYPDFNSSSPFCVTTDASGSGAGAVLTQTQEGVERVIGYAGTSFNKAQLRYSPTDRELAAIRFAVNHFKQYLYGRHFVIKTDHQPLIYLHHLKRFDDRLHRTLEDLNIGHYEFEYLPGKSNVVADSLSRADYPWELPTEVEYPIRQESRVSLEDFEVVRVSGGANSLFDSISLSLYDNTSRSLEVREMTVEKLLERPVKYGFPGNARGSKQIKVLLHEHAFPPFSAVQGIADAIDATIIVNFVGGPVITVIAEKETKTIELLCSGGVHFDLLKSKVSGSVNVGDVICSAEMGVDDALSLASSSEVVRNFQVRDEILAKLRKLVETGTRPKKKTDLAIFRRYFNGLTIDSNNMLMFADIASAGKAVPVVPANFLTPLATELHEVVSHAGRNKVVKVMATKFFHPRMSGAIGHAVQSCQVCQFHKGNAVNKFPLLKRSPEKALDLYAVDLMDMPQSKRGYKCLLVGIDLKTKYGHAIPIKSKRSEAVSRALESHILATLPQNPRSILSDNGPEFRGKPFKDLLSRYGIRHENSIPYAPHTNGAVERLNRTIKEKLAIVSHGESRRWDTHVHNVIAQYNRMPHSETGVPPAEFFLQDKAEIIVPTRTFWKLPPHFKGFQIGDLVLRKTPYTPPGQHNKLNPRYQGPLRIVHRDDNGITYKAQWLGGAKKCINVHVSQLKKYHGGHDGINPQETTAPKKPRRRERVLELPQEVPTLHNPDHVDWENIGNIPLGEIDDPVLPAEFYDPVLPAELDSDLGSWEMSPDVSDILSDGCFVHGPGGQDSPLTEEIVSDTCDIRESTPLPGTRLVRRLPSGLSAGIPHLNLETGESSEDYFSGFQSGSSDRSESIPDETRSNMRDECVNESGKMFWSHHYLQFHIPEPESLNDSEEDNLNEGETEYCECGLSECEECMMTDTRESLDLIFDSERVRKLNSSIKEVIKMEPEAREMNDYNSSIFECVLGKSEEESCDEDAGCFNFGRCRIV